LRIWIVAFVLLLILCGGAEWFWRSAGHRPTVVDDPDWWAFHRGRIYNGPKTIVLVGASRIQLGMSTETIRDMLPDHAVVQLAVDGHGPLEVLQDLSNDGSFNGLVICAANYSGQVPRSNMSEYLDAYHRKRQLNNQLNRRIATWLQGQLVFIHPTVQSASTLNGLVHGQGLPEPFYLATHFDRSRSADYTMVHPAVLESTRRHGIDLVDEKQWERRRSNWPKRIEQGEAAVRKIQDRGGDVVFVSFPMSGQFVDVSERETPRDIYWDRFAAQTNGIPIQYVDIPGLDGFDPPDGLHLDYRDAAPFTEAFINELIRQGVLPRE
jgi:hypothetical protein